MKPYILTNNEFLNFFSKLPLKSKQQLIPTLNRGEINTTSEVCKNFLSKNLTKCPRIIRKVKSAKREIKAISLKSVPLYRKKKILQSRSGGALLSILLPLAATLLGSLIRK